MTTDLTADSQVRRKRCPYPAAPGHEANGHDDPVQRVRTPRGLDAWIVTRYMDVRDVFGDPERFSARPDSVAHIAPNLDPDSEIGLGQFNRMDGYEHFRFRRLIGSDMTGANRMTQLRPAVDRVVNDRIDALSGRTGIDLYTDFATPVTLAALAVYMDIPHIDLDRFREAVLAHLDAMCGADEAAQQSGLLSAYVDTLIDRRRAKPGNDPISRLLARSDCSVEPFGHVEINRLGCLLVSAGFFLTAGTLAECVVTLLRHPREFARLREDPTLVAGAVEELLRCLGLPGLLRVATEDTEIAGCPIKAGDYVIAGVGAANFDPDAFPDPERLDFERSPNHHLGFGYGPHQCVGHQLARLLLGTTLSALARRIPSLRLAAPAQDVEIDHDTFVFAPTRLPVTWDEIRPAKMGA